MKRRGVLGCDMGTANTMVGLAYKGRFSHSGQIQNTVRSLMDVAPKKHKNKPDTKRVRFAYAVIKFETEWTELLQRVKPKRVLVERFMGRGRLSGITQECVNVSIGVMTSVCNRIGIPIRTVTASSWKNAINRRFKSHKGKPLDTIYKIFRVKDRHFVDALLMAHYRMDPTYKKFKSVKRVIKALTPSIEKAIAV